ncbi:MAG: hypothetical protein EPN93_16025 [Spirochaetes bacterium]|nr:MAG: hypothetical protein EPN93_16025 [Spirochaetota bacterium]
MGVRFASRASACLLLIFMLFRCGASRSSLPRIEARGLWIDTIKVVGPADAPGQGVPLRIYIPRTLSETGERRTLIALHGYRGNFTEWGANTEIQKFAEEFGIAIVCPDMGATLYETRYYPETQVKWNPQPGGSWITAVLLPFLRENYGLARSRSHTGIMGVSTGGRGALLMASLHPDLFQSAAGISGYYDTSVMTGNPLLPTVYGPYAGFKERWEKDDNIMELAANLADTPVYLAHGFKDRDIPIEQSQLLGMKIRQLRKQSPGKFPLEFQELPQMSHGWVYWRLMTGDVLSFFDKTLAR